MTLGEGRATMRRRSEYDPANREAAAIILAAPERYGGPDSLVVQWARAITHHQAPKVRPPAGEPGQLGLELLPETP